MGDLVLTERRGQSGHEDASTEGGDRDHRDAQPPAAQPARTRCTCTSTGAATRQARGGAARGPGGEQDAARRGAGGGTAAAGAQPHGIDLDTAAIDQALGAQGQGQRRRLPGQHPAGRDDRATAGWRCPTRWARHRHQLPADGRRQGGDHGRLRPHGRGGEPGAPRACATTASRSPRCTTTCSTTSRGCSSCTSGQTTTPRNSRRASSAALEKVKIAKSG